MKTVPGLRPCRTTRKIAFVKSSRPIIALAETAQPTNSALFGEATNLESATSNYLEPEKSLALTRPR